MRRPLIVLALATSCSARGPVPESESGAEVTTEASSRAEEAGDSGSSSDAASSSDTSDEASESDESTSGAHAECGDGVVDPGEQCDGEELNGQSCESIGYSTGQLLCGDDCYYDDSQCSIECPPFDAGYPPCVEGECSEDAQCWGEFGANACMPLGCNSTCPCPDGATGTASPACVPAFGIGGMCLLECSNSKLCPDGMQCVEQSYCAWPVP